MRISGHLKVDGALGIEAEGTAITEKNGMLLV
jgi:hypothetical protein